MPTLYTGSVIATGGREGHVTSSDGQLSLPTQKPTSMGGTGQGTNPEQLFAAAYGACYGGALLWMAERDAITLPENWQVETLVGFNVSENGSLFLTATLNVSLVGLEKTAAEKLAQKAHHSCPYSRAVKGNIEVVLNVLV